MFQFQPSPRHMLLADAIGASISAIIIAFILPRLCIGIPSEVLYMLAAIASVFFIVSLSGFLWAKNKSRLWLRVTAGYNFMYVCSTCVLVLYYRNDISFLGVFYFVSEIALLIILVLMEIKIAGKK